MQCSSMYQGELYTEETNERLGHDTTQENQPHLQLKDEGHCFEDDSVHILNREDWWFESGVKQANYIKHPLLNWGGGLQHHLSTTYSAVLTSLPRYFPAHMMAGCDLNNPEGVNDSTEVKCLTPHQLPAILGKQWPGSLRTSADVESLVSFRNQLSVNIFP